MQHSSLIVAGAALLALAACGKADTATAAKSSSVSIDIDSAGKNDGAKSSSAVTIDGNSDDGNVELNLPGGIAARINLPDGLADGGEFDIDGVGLYPGAKVRSVKVNASDRSEARRAVVQIGFTAPADAAAVADWYQQQFDARQQKIARVGETLSGVNADGDDFTLALTSAGTGNAKGLLTITDAAKG